MYYFGFTNKSLCHIWTPIAQEPYLMQLVRHMVQHSFFSSKEKKKKFQKQYSQPELILLDPKAQREANPMFVYSWEVVIPKKDS